MERSGISAGLGHLYEIFQNKYMPDSPSSADSKIKKRIKNRAPLDVDVLTPVDGRLLENTCVTAGFDPYDLQGHYQPWPSSYMQEHIKAELAVARAKIEQEKLLWLTNRAPKEVTDKPEDGIQVTRTDDLLQEITVSDGYMRVKHTKFYKPKWWQFWKAPSVTKQVWYTTLSSPERAMFSDWCTEDGRGVTDTRRLWLQDIADTYFGSKRAEKAAEKLRAVEEKMNSPEMQALDPSSPSFDPLKKVKEKDIGRL